MISVIIPTYKRPDTLKRAIKSVLDQTYSDFEVLIINDDREGYLTIEKLVNAFKDSRLKCYNNERIKGGNGARNTGILKSSRPFVAFLDDDDEWLQNKLEYQLKDLTKRDNSFAAVYSGYLIENNGTWNEYYGKMEGNIFKEVLLNETKICTGSNLLIRKEVIEEVGLWDEELLRQQDLEFLLRVLIKYKLGFDRNLGAKIYGHNIPNPEKAFREREKFLIKISGLLVNFKKEDKDKFYSDHYRRQSLYLIKMRRNQLALKTWFKAMKYNTFSPVKDGKLILTMLNSLIKKH